MTAPVASGGSEFAGWDLHPLESAALSRRTSRAEIVFGFRRNRTAFGSGNCLQHAKMNAPGFKPGMLRRLNDNSFCIYDFFTNSFVGIEMTRDETIALWQRCEDTRTAALNEGRVPAEAHERAKAVWNEWAENMLALKKVLEEKGLFRTQRDKAHPWVGLTIASNIETAKWLTDARTDFSGYVFQKFADFGGFIFPGQAVFGYAAALGHNRIDFARTIFQ